MAEKCSAIARSGSRCSSAAKKGGRNRSAQARAAAAIPEAMTPAELSGWLSMLFRSVVAGHTEPRVGSAAATIAKVLIEARAVADQPTVEELRDQLDTLRAMVERTAGGRAA